MEVQRCRGGALVVQRREKEGWEMPKQRPCTGGAEEQRAEVNKEAKEVHRCIGEELQRQRCRGSDVHRSTRSIGA